MNRIRTDPDARDGNRWTGHNEPARQIAARHDESTRTHRKCGAKQSGGDDQVVKGTDSREIDLRNILHGSNGG
jgi:hypothetical protein